jgi:KaiC/GvpD/RAD55 family RecA-like ATPase
MTLTTTELEERRDVIFGAAQERQQGKMDRQIQQHAAYQYISPLSKVYSSLVEMIESHEDRFTLGLAQIDLMTRGFGPKELILITGFTHAGKTQLVNTAIIRNPDKRVLFFSMDDPSEMILLKLACMTEGIGAEIFEQRIREGDQEALLALQRTSSRESLIVVDTSLSIAGVGRAVDEATQFWGQPPDVVIIDYLTSISGDEQDGDGGVKSKVAELKRWVKDKPFPTLCLHQNTRSKGGPGEEITLISAAFGGEQEATMLLGVRRRRDDSSLDQFERDQQANTVTLHLVKNKRPPGRVTHPSGIDFWMVPETGLIRPLRDDDLNRTPTQAMDMIRQGQVMQDALAPFVAALATEDKDVE